MRECAVSCGLHVGEHGEFCFVAVRDQAYLDLESRSVRAGADDGSSAPQDHGGCDADTLLMVHGKRTVAGYRIYGVPNCLARRTELTLDAINVSRVTGVACSMRDMARRLTFGNLAKW